MPTILADTFSVALAKLTNHEQKRAKLTVYDLQTEPDRPGLQMHRIDKSRDDNFWSVRVSSDIRIVVHKTGNSLMLCYVGHHDDAYSWAERRIIDAHPRTGAIQIREVREMVEEMPARTLDLLNFAESEETGARNVSRSEPAPLPRLFSSLDTEMIMSVGVPEDWASDVLRADEDTFFELASHLPQEASEALLEYVASGSLPIPSARETDTDPLEHPDSLRRFRVLEDIEELQAALEDSFEKWTIFLHPAQRGVVNQKLNGPARVAGSAGTGKTVVALHRVVKLLRQDPRTNVLLTTFSEPLARTLDQKLELLLGAGSPLQERVSVASFSGIAAELVTLATGRKPHMASNDVVRSTISRVATSVAGVGLSDQFLYSEWTHVIDAWQILSAEDYATVPRMGRKNRLGPRQRERVWALLDKLRADLVERGMLTKAGLFDLATQTYADQVDKPFTHIVVDEAQDLAVPELRFLASISGSEPDALFFAGDLGQRIFQQPFSWLGLGVDVRGRSATLRVNYRTSHQIRSASDRLMPKKVRDADGLEDDRANTVSVFNGPAPTVQLFERDRAEIEYVALFLAEVIDCGVSPNEIGIFVRSTDQLGRARDAAKLAGLPVRSMVQNNGQLTSASCLVGIMHLAKGLEFRVVVVMACDEDVLPLSSRVADVVDEFELDEVLSTERQLLYVAMTRARDRLIVTGVAPGSQFLDDLAIE